MDDPNLRDWRNLVLTHDPKDHDSDHPRIQKKVIQFLNSLNNMDLYAEVQFFYYYK